jgi:hypothetical protein
MGIKGSIVLSCAPAQAATLNKALSNSHIDRIFNGFILGPPEGKESAKPAAPAGILNQECG